MPNRILRIELENRSTVPSEAEVYLTVEAEDTAGVEVRARLMGPRCEHASTVEVAYHFRPVLVPTPRPALTYRAVIPEASPWSPQTPHLYHGVVELWKAGRRLDSRHLRLGLRDFRVGPRGLRCNGQVLRLRGVGVSTLDDAEAARLREQGFGLLLCPAEWETRGVWDIASRVGFAVVGRVVAGTRQGLLQELSQEPSALGWLLDGYSPAVTPPTGTLLGTPPDHPAAGAAQFVAAPAGSAAPEGKPVLLLGAGETANPLVGQVVA